MRFRRAAVPTAMGMWRPRARLLVQGHMAQRLLPCLAMIPAASESSIPTCHSKRQSRRSRASCPPRVCSPPEVVSRPAAFELTTHKHSTSPHADVFPCNPRCCAALAVVQGWKVAEHAAANPSAAASVVPLPVLFFVLPLALIVAGTVPQFVGPGAGHAGLLAMVVGSMLTMTVAISTLRYPTGVSTLVDVRSPDFMCRLLSCFAQACSHA